MKRIVHLPLIFVIILLTTSLSAQNKTNKNILPGSWLGKISTNGADLRLIFNLKVNDKDSLIATLDSPDQGAKNIPLGSVIVDEKKLTIKAPMLMGEYAEAALNYLKNNPKINKKEIGFIGHSEGGLIAPIVASSRPDVGFIVSLAGPGVTGQQIILRQTQDISRLSGVKENEIKESTETNKRLYAVLRKEKDNKKAEIKILALYKEILEKKKTSKEDTEKAVNQLKMTFGSNIYTWFRYFIITDPSVFWKKVECPVLALNGEKDLQVSAKENLPAIEKALRSSGNKSVKTVKLPELNHLFQHCNTGLPSEYSSIEETFSPGALKIIADWILAL